MPLWCRLNPPRMNAPASATEQVLRQVVGLPYPEGGTPLFHTTCISRKCVRNCNTVHLLVNGTIWYHCDHISAFRCNKTAKRSCVFLLGSCPGQKGLVFYGQFLTCTPFAYPLISRRTKWSAMHGSWRLTADVWHLLGINSHETGFHFPAFNQIFTEIGLKMFTQMR